MSKTTMQELAEYGQSIWLDYIDRPLLETDKLKNMIANGLRGLTSNPSIFNNAIGSSADYDEKIRELRQAGKTTFEIYDELTIKDIQDAADQFKGIYDETDGLDGYVSLEIDPKIAHQSQEQIDEGKRLFEKVNRPNVMIKVPSTEAGIPVIEELIASGISVNATLIFSVEQYEQVVKSYYRGVQRRVDEGKDVSGIRSVASVFISRIDSAVDKLIDECLVQKDNSAKKEILQSLYGKAAVANSRLIFEKWKASLESPEVEKLKGKNANVQRVLWASTGTKNPKYSDIKYVTELITVPTINTLPEKTLEAFLDHGQMKEAFEEDPKKEEEIIEGLKEFGIDVNAVCNKLLKDGVVAFEDAFTSLFESIEKKAAELSVRS